MSFLGAVWAATRIGANIGRYDLLLKEADANWRRCCREHYPEADQQESCYHPSHGLKIHG